MLRCVISSKVPSKKKKRRRKAPQKGGFGFNSLFNMVTCKCKCACQFVSACVDTRVEFIIGRTLPSGPQRMSTNTQLSLLSILYFLFSQDAHLPKNTIKEGEVGAVGRKLEAEGRTRKRNEGFKEEK